jgi:hypothetical protein
VPRDRIVLDGASPPAGIPPGVAGLLETRLRLADATARADRRRVQRRAHRRPRLADRRQPRRPARADVVTA